MSAPEVAILRAFIAAGDGWVSGAKLATRLGVSRVAVWHHLEKLRAEGFAFEGKPAQGYRLSARPAGLSGPWIDAQLQIRPKDFSLVVLDEIDSTNDEAARQLAAGRPAPFVVLARRQTRGRGRFGRAWHSAANGNLYASFAFRPRVPPDRMQTFTLWMGVNVCELIVNFAGLNPGLKWPNDLVFAGRKAGGMLTEARVDADQIRDLVFGLGLNINGAPAAWPDELSHRAISLSEVAGGPLDFNRLTAALIGRVLLAYDTFAEGEHRRTFADLWNRFDLLKGRTVVVVEGDRRHAGTVTGVDDEGGLVLRDERGRSQRFRAGEVTLEK
jgi:BirA family biotin operon repressor/biotin-[acetyl-CoA-carboxylase] ligase